MMEVILAKNAGFCFGVKRAVDTVYEQLKTGNNIYTYGPIVHNEEVISELSELGVEIIEDREALKNIHDGCVIIRAHGVPEEVQREMLCTGSQCIDATCPFVKRIHKIVEENSLKGKFIVIMGNPGHPEVEGIVGWCKGPVKVLETPEDAEKFQVPDGMELTVVFQTTYNYNKFQDIVEIFKNKGYNDSVVDTICNATQDRQNEAKDLASKADAMIVIGGKHSSNTRKLYEISKEHCENTYLIQTLDDLYLELPKSARLVGITAGASTPNKLIEEVQNYVRINF